MVAMQAWRRRKRNKKKGKKKGQKKGKKKGKKKGATQHTAKVVDFTGLQPPHAAEQGSSGSEIAVTNQYFVKTVHKDELRRTLLFLRRKPGATFLFAKIPGRSSTEKNYLLVVDYYPNLRKLSVREVLEDNQLLQKVEEANAHMQNENAIVTSDGRTLKPVNLDVRNNLFLTEAGEIVLLDAAEVRYMLSDQVPSVKTRLQSPQPDWTNAKKEEDRLLRRHHLDVAQCMPLPEHGNLLSGEYTVVTDTVVTDPPPASDNAPESEIVPVEANALRIDNVDVKEEEEEEECAPPAAFYRERAKRSWIDMFEEGDIRDDGAMDDSAMDDGAMDDGAMDDGAKDDGAKDDGARDDGGAREGALRPL
jgi:hypothetical protein